MRKIALILPTLIMSTAMASEVTTDDLSSPTVELVKTIHDFCLEQNLGQDELNADKNTLQCVNSDLEISTYTTFKTYTELTSFISQKKESTDENIY